ncbi:MAG: STT3 domain-containing protein [Candidatus Nanoarchaeia archaeon]
MSKNKHKYKEETKDSEETVINFSGLKKTTKTVGKGFSWVKRNIFTKTATIWMLVVLLIVISVYVRMGPATLPVTDQWAESTVLGNIQNNIAAQVRVERPDLPEASVNQLAQSEFDTFYAQNKAQIDAQIELYSAQFKQQLQDDQGMTHLLGIDEYLWYSYAKWYETNGYYGTDVVNGEERFLLRYGRFGWPTYFIFSSYPINFLHNIIQIFNNDQTIKQTAFYISVILMAIASVFAFFLGRKMFGNIGGFFAATTIAVSGMIVGRTLVGAPESDGYTIIFPMLITWLYFEALDFFDKDKIMKGLIVSLIAALAMSLFYFFWGGWWFTLLLIIGMTGIYIIYRVLLRYKDGEKKLFQRRNLELLIFPVVFFFASIIFAVSITGLVGDFNTSPVTTFLSAPLQPFDFITGFKSAAAGNIIGENYALWPNVLRTVAELNPASIKEVIGSPGSFVLGKLIIPFFWLGVLGIILLFFRYKEDYKYPFYGAFLGIWLISTLYAGTTGVRFMVFTAIVIAFGIGSLVAYITGPGLNAISKKLEPNMKSFLKWAFIIILFFALLWTPIKNAKAIGDNSVPIFDDAWYESMKPIAENPNKAVISSWWDYGHFFQAYTNQTVTFDGGDQGKRIYWIGRTLVTNDEDEALDVLKMLNCAEEEGYNLLKTYLVDEMKTTKVMFEITREDKAEAEKTLKAAGLTSEQTEAVLKLTHCSDLYDMYYVTSEDMVGKATVWGHFGSWNFERAYFYYHLKNLPLPEAIEHAKRDLGYDANKTREMYNQAKKIASEDEAASWISIYPGYITQDPVSCLKEPGKEIITCNYNLLLNQQPGVNVVLTRGMINLTSVNDSVFVLQVVDQRTGGVIQQNTLVPSAIVLGIGEELERYELKETNFGYDFLIYETEGSYYSLISNEALATSMFTRLFYMNGKYTEHFDKVSDITSFRGERIIVWKVNP